MSTPDNVAAAAERLELAETDFASAYAELAAPSGQRLLDYVTVANAYLAREAAISTCEQTCDAATTDRIARMIAGAALFDVYPPPSELEEKWREPWSQARYLEDLEAFAETQIARKAELEKPVDHLQTLYDQDWRKFRKTTPGGGDAAK